MNGAERHAALGAAERLAKDAAQNLYELCQAARVGRQLDREQAMRTADLLRHAANLVDDASRVPE